MKQLTIRNIPDGIEKIIKKEAKKNQKSMNKIVISLLEEATSLKAKKSIRKNLYHDLDHLAGSWSKVAGGQVLNYKF